MKTAFAGSIASIAFWTHGDDVGEAGAGRGRVVGGGVAGAPGSSFTFFHSNPLPRDEQH